MRRFVLSTAAALLLGACATMTVSSHVQPNLDIARYHTFDWGPADALPTGDPRLDNDPFFKDHMQGAVEKQMAAHGLARAESGPADLLIHYHANITERLNVTRAEWDQGYCFEDDCVPGTIEYEAGTLVVDLVDARTNRVIWRGWAQDSVEETLGNESRMARQIDEAVQRMFMRFPRPL